jgi:hypothetical protein
VAKGKGEGSGRGGGRGGGGREGEGDGAAALLKSRGPHLPGWEKRKLPTSGDKFACSLGRLRLLDFRFCGFCHPKKHFWEVGQRISRNPELKLDLYLVVP